ncbi:hypothetical protein [Bradyrhizobium sp.]|uniref:hypothetical protein n=1 Tax=Bradyrhizobium sp. TaxID=376 RepID=UPI001ED388A5|nr:hypothetical protein [Bradyrhizobium sp.]MBV8893878.1 hypothetical protein [Acidobacteriota bacterium]MBV8918650.1 hypothetical protein [Bradyrhizobium sp.]MBV9982285.1 hypothetical protein [Bradyrhizobium sp.]
MKNLLPAIAIVLSTAPAQACGIFGIDWLGTCKIASDAKAAVDEAMQQVRQTQDYVVHNTPGLHDVADLNELASSDPKVRKAVIDRYRNLLAAAEGVDQAETKIPVYKLAISYDFDATKVFRANHVRWTDGSETTARLFLENNSVELWTDQARPKRANIAPPNEAQVRQQLLEKADAFLDSLTGPQVDTHISGAGQLAYPNAITVSRKYALTPETVGPDTPRYQAVQPQINEQREAIKARLVDIILSAYSYSEDRVGNTDSMYDWSLTDGKTNVILYVDDTTYNEQKDYDWKITVRVQRDSDPSQSLKQRYTREVHQGHFHQLKLQDGTGRIAYWTQLEMTAENLPTVGVLAALAEHKKVLEAIEGAK